MHLRNTQLGRKLVVIWLAISAIMACVLWERPDVFINLGRYIRTCLVPQFMASSLILMRGSIIVLCGLDGSAELSI